MSSIGLDPTESADFADQAARNPGMPGADPWLTWGTLASPAVGIAAGAANISFLGEELATPVLKPIAEEIDKQFGTSSAAWLGEQQRLSRAAIVKQQEISPHVFGQVGDIVRGAFQFGSEALGGAAVGGPVGAAAVTGAAESFAHYRKLISDGVDPDTAAQLAGVEGLVAGATANIPLVGKNLLASAARGAVLMPYMNAWQRGVTHQVLDNAGYHDMAEQYKILDGRALLTDAAMGALFGGIGHVLHGTPPAEAYPTLTDAVLTDAVARDREARGPGIPADGYTRNANGAALEKTITDTLEGNPADPSEQIDPERASFVPDPHEEEFRAQVADVVREEVGPLPADQPGEPPAPAAAPDERDIVSPIDRTAAPEEKVSQMVALSKENAPAVDTFLAGVDRDFGTESKSNFKEPAKILEKSTRPSIVAQKPWFAVEHIRDAFRFKTVLPDLTQLPDILARARAQGWQMVKADTAKVLAPKEWGFRIAAFDMRMPNGQIVEYYLPVREMEAAKNAPSGHELFEKWRNRDVETLSKAERAEMYADIETSANAYNAAWQAYLKRTGQDETAVRAALTSAEEAATGAREKFAARSSAENLRPDDHLPEASRQAAQPSAASTITRPSSATETMGGLSGAGLTSGSIAETVPAGNVFPGAVHGASTEVKIGDTYTPAHWAIVPAAELEATVANAENQARNRNRAAAAVQVAEIANNLDYKLLGKSPVMDFGAPTLAADGRVVGGNGRLFAIKQAYKQGNGEGAYAEPLRGDLATYGLDNDAARGVPEPVLVRILEPGTDIRRAAIASNEGGAMRMSALEQAKVDAERLPDTRLLSANEAGNLNVPANREIIQQWVGEFPAGQRAALLDADGALSAEGLTRLRNAVLFKAYGDSPTLTRLVESADPDIKNVGNALVRAAPVVAGARAGIEAGALHPADIAADLTSAIERYAAAKAENRDLREHVAQQGLFGAEMTPEAKRILSFIDSHARSSRAMADMIAGYYERLRAAGDPNQADIFGGGEKPTKAALLEATIGEQGKQTALEREAQAALFDNPNMQVPTETGELVPARDAIAAANQEIAQAGKAQDMLDAAINCDRKAA